MRYHSILSDAIDCIHVRSLFQSSSHVLSFILFDINHCICVRSVLTETSSPMSLNRHYDPIFKTGWGADGEDSSSESEEDEAVIVSSLDIPLSIIQAECADMDDTATHAIINHTDLGTQCPSEKVLMAVNSLDLNRIINAHCCSLSCLCKFDSQLIRACCIRYLSMSQAASRQWLRMMMENQPLQNQQYHIHHQVCLSFCLLHWGSCDCCSECADGCS